MKKLLALILSLVLAFTVAGTALADSNIVDMEPTLLSIMDQTSAEWYEDDTSRVLLATCGLIDVLLSDYESFAEIAKEAVVKDNVYVAKKNLELYIFFFGDSQVLVVSFLPATDAMQAFSIAVDTSYPTVYLSSMKSEGLVTTYYNVPSDDIMLMFELILDALDS